MKVVEMIGIEQARSWGVCTLNEFRQYLGLKEYDSFEEWNPDPEIANAARALYGHIDNLELYVGMQAEEAKVPGEGAGLCPGYTISRAILGDAVALTRGDRFFTHDFNPYNLTAWGYQDCAHTPTNGAFGGGISKLLFRSLPNNFSFNSVYGLFPFYTPKTCEVNLSKLDLVDKYDFERPKTEKPVVSVNTWDGVKQVLGDYRSFKTTYEEHMKALTNGYGFFLAFDDPAKHLADMKIVRDALFPNDQAFEAYGEFYRDTTARLIEEKSFSLVGKGTRSVDIVRDVLNLVPVHWVSRKVAGIPLKTPQTPDGVHTEQEVYQYLAVVFTYIFLNVDPANGWPLRANAEKVAKLLQGYTKGHIDAMRSTTVLGRLKDTLLGWVTGEKTDDLDFLRRLAASGRSSDVLAYNVFGIIIASSPNFSQAAAQVVNFYLDDARAKERKEVVRLCHSEAPEDNKLLLGYIMEAMRLDPQAPGIFREAARDADVVEGNDVPSVKVTKGQRLFVSLYNANHDPSVFGPDPSAIDPTRSPDVYMTFGSGMHKCLGQWFVLSVMPQVMRSIFTLKNVRRAPGESGKLNRFQQRLYGSTPGNLYIDARGNVTPWPASMTIQYDI
ncbi:hypothetical protein FRB99_001047 [Tulasnella sp. 403]|nr:hypothetical protein FRB99_001047 [Tulasnella sp. 403]